MGIKKIAVMVVAAAALGTTIGYLTAGVRQADMTPARACDQIVGAPWTTTVNGQLYVCVSNGAPIPIASPTATPVS